MQWTIHIHVTPKTLSEHNSSCISSHTSKLLEIIQELNYVHLFAMLFLVRIEYEKNRILFLALMSMKAYMHKVTVI